MVTKKGDNYIGVVWGWDHLESGGAAKNKERKVKCWPLQIGIFPV